MILNKHMDSKGGPFIKIDFILQTFKSYINFTNPTYKVNFNRPNTLRELLGYKSKILNSGYNVSDNAVQITTPSSILIHCVLISGSLIIENCFNN